jgi:hypothetical protein
VTAAVDVIRAHIPERPSWVCRGHPGPGAKPHWPCREVKAAYEAEERRHQGHARARMALYALDFAEDNPAMPGEYLRFRFVDWLPRAVALPAVGPMSVNGRRPR